jgi:hypothetical protein
MAAPTTIYITTIPEPYTIVWPGGLMISDLATLNLLGSINGTATVTAY